MSNSVDQVKLLFGFLHHVSSLSAVDASTNEDGFANEFYELKAMSTQLKTNDKYNTTAGSLPINKKKNRYKDILPFEPRRVELYPIEGEEGSEYINASYVADPLNKLSYIAAQGPNSYTVNDFWRMLWYHAIEVVVMACREIELGKSKCKQYWVSPGEVQQFGAITVTHVSDDNISEDFIQRKMHIKCGDEDQMLTQLHYTGWPDHGVPSNVKPILNIIKKFRAIVPYGNDVPIVIHCSAGCGRTGTLIGIDYAWSLLENKRFKSANQVYEVVESMRKQRPAMVQTKDQYVLVYKAVFHLVRKYLDEYQHDPSVLHMFDESVAEKLSQITLPEPQNPSGIDEAAFSTELGGEVEDDFSSNSASPMRNSMMKNDSGKHLRPLLPPQKPFISSKPDILKKSLPLPSNSPEPSISVRSLDAIRDNSAKVQPELKAASSDQAMKPIIPPSFQQKSPRPTLPHKRVSLSENGLPPKFAIFEPKKSIPISSLGQTSEENVVRPVKSKFLDRPLTSSFSYARTDSPPPVTSKKSAEIQSNVNTAPMVKPYHKNSPVPLPLPTKKASTSKASSPTEPPETPNSVSSISELLRGASIDKTAYSDDDDDDSDGDDGNGDGDGFDGDEVDYWEPRNNQPVAKATLQQNKLESSCEHILLNQKKGDNSPPPLIPPRNSTSNNNLSQSTASLPPDAPPVPLKTMEDRDMMGSMENIIAPPPSINTLVPISPPTTNPEEDYEEIRTVKREIEPVKPEIYKAPRNDPIPVAAYLEKNTEKLPSLPSPTDKPNPTPPYQSKKGVGHLILSLKKHVNSSKLQNLSNAPNIPDSDTMVTTDQQRHLNKRGNIEYGPVGFGIRLTKPKGPRTMPQHFGNFAKESL